MEAVSTSNRPASPVAALALVSSFAYLACAGPPGPPGASGVAPGGGTGASGGPAGVDAGSAGGAGGAGGGGATGGDPDAGAADLTLTVQTDKGARPISPYVYGMNYGLVGTAPAKSVKAPLFRLGGNDLSGYNWEIDATNGGDHKGFANRALGAGTGTGASILETLGVASANAGAAVVTVPMGDFVAADTLPGDVHGSGPGYLATRFRKNVVTKGGPFAASPDASDDSVYQDEAVSWVAAHAGAAPVFFSLDNQPELWAEDHSEIHPAAPTYAEVIARSVAFAKMIKGTSPSALVTGYASYGWQGYVNLQNAPDGTGKGEFVSYYLDQMRLAEQAGGTRLLDYLDLHWWPEATGGGVRIIGADAGPEVVLARLSAPRSLWDASYVEKSWIADNLQINGDTIRLLPRARGWIADHYPGTKLAISAWYYGGGGDVSGAIATADVLGIFGREGVDLAAVDLTSGDESFTIAAFRAYLDFDGAGAHFGNTSVQATTSDVSGSSLYASVDAGDPSRVVVVALNKRSEARSAVLTVGGSFTTCAVYRLEAASAAFSARSPVAAASPGVFRTTIPGRSITVFVVRP